MAMMAIGRVDDLRHEPNLPGFTSTAVAVFGIYFKLQSFIFMPIFGLNNGMVPIIVFNYGARHRSDCETIRLSVIVAMSFMLWVSGPSS